MSSKEAKEGADGAPPAESGSEDAAKTEAPTSEPDISLESILSVWCEMICGVLLVISCLNSHLTTSAASYQRITESAWPEAR